MTANIELLGYQKQVTGVSIVEFPLTDTTTVFDAFNHIAETYPKLHLDPERVIYNINGELAKADTVLQAGDTIRLLPTMGGG